MNQIFLRAVRILLDPPAIGGNRPSANQIAKRPVFDIEYATESGDIIRGDVVCTSSSFKNDTFNFKFTASGEIRTAHASLLLSINGKEVML